MKTSALSVYLFRCDPMCFFYALIVLFGRSQTGTKETLTSCLLKVGYKHISYKNSLTWWRQSYALKLLFPFGLEGSIVLSKYIKSNMWDVRWYKWSEIYAVTDVTFAMIIVDCATCARALCFCWISNLMYGCNKNVCSATNIILCNKQLMTTSNP